MELADGVNERLVQHSSGNVDNNFFSYHFSFVSYFLLRCLLIGSRNID